MRRAFFGVVVGALLVASFVAPSAGATTAGAQAVRHATFYLDLKAGQCVGSPLKRKELTVELCANPQHVLEIYAVTHGGWTTHNRPSERRIKALARTVCLSTFQRLYGSALHAPYGWLAYWPDASGEARTYHDRLICGITRYPKLGAMGAGTHFRQAAR